MHQRIYVWDKFVRLFHWSLVALFVTSYLTGENEHWFHFYSGYAIVTLIALRLIWGFAGTKHARFKDFVRSPWAVFSYLKSIAQGTPKRYLGHNPAGGAMVVLLLTALLTTTISGMKLLAIEEGEGPFASNINVTFVRTSYADDDDYKHDHEKQDSDEYEKDHEQEEYHSTYEQLKEEGEDYEADESPKYASKADAHTYGEDHEAEEAFWEEIHEASISFMLLLIILHVVGVIVAGRQHKESLVKSMITGFKNQ